MLRVLLLMSIVFATVSSYSGHHKLKMYYGNFGINTANLTVINGVQDRTSSLAVFMQTENCYTCDLVFITMIEYKSNKTLSVDTRWFTRLAIYNNEVPSFLHCSEAEISHYFEENGVYKLWVSKSKNNVSCVGPVLDNGPGDNNIPIFVAMGVFFAISLFWITFKYLYRHHYFYRILPSCCFGTESILDPDLGLPSRINEGDETSADTTTGTPPVKQRLRSLDSFRGICIVVMIFVNYGGGEYWFLKHSKWNGLTVADLVFPWFIFIMGTSLAMSMRSQLRRSIPKRWILWKIIKRSGILFLLGLIINTGPGSDTVEYLRIPGVLQRFAVTYLVVASAHVIQAETADVHQHKWWSSFRDLVIYWFEWLLQFALIGIYLGLTYGLNVPGCPKGYLGPGGLSDHSHHKLCTGGAAGYIDRQIFTAKHMYGGGTYREIYDTIMPHDPEGLLGCFTSIFLCFLGLQSGKVIITFPDWVTRLKRWLTWAVILSALATLLCKGSKNDGWIPVNKNLWSLSYVLLMAGFAFFLLTFCYLLIDVYNVWTGAPFLFPGKNAILLYMCHEIFSKRFPIDWTIGDNHASWLAMNVYSTSFWIIVSYFLFRKNIFISI